MAYKRSIFLINKPFQLRHSFYVCSWLFVLSLIYPWIIYTLFNYFLAYMKLDPMGPELARIESTKGDMLKLLAFLQILFLVVTFSVNIFISHRIAGPLYKLRRFFEQAGKGNMSPKLQFRKGDHFQDLAMSYNEMMTGLNAKIGEAAAEIEAGRSEKGLAMLRQLQGVNPETGA